MNAKTAARIEALRHSPGWDDLVEWLTEIDEKYWQRVVADMKTGREKAKPVNQREIDYARGLRDGIRHLLVAPEKAAKIYERQTEGVEAS